MTFHFEAPAPKQPPPVAYREPECNERDHVWTHGDKPPEPGMPCKCGRVRYGEE